MKQLLLDVRARLRNKITYIENLSVYISIEPLLYASLPAIWIRDGEIEFDRSTVHVGRRQLTRLRVEIAVLVAIPRADQPEAPLTGDGTEKGVLEIIADVHKWLNRGGSDAWRPTAATGASYKVPPIPLQESRITVVAVANEAGDEARPWAVQKGTTYEFLRDEVVP